ncbi:MAG: DUF1328 family protein [Dehalococcoidia bacterium]
MLRCAFAFLLFALVAAVLGFGFLADMAANIAIILFVVFVVLFVLSVAFPRWRRR